MTDARDIDCPKCAKSGDDCGEHSPSWEELVDYWKNEAASLRKQLAAQDSLAKIVHENGPVVIDFWGEELAWRPLDYGTWTALASIEVKS